MLSISPLAPKDSPALPPIRGVKLATAPAGIKYVGRDEIVLLVCDKAASVAGVFTRSQTSAAPVQWCRRAMSESAQMRALVVNAGNANAFTGERGVADVRSIVESVAKQLGCATHEVLICSTGVIGEFLPTEKILNALPPMISTMEDAGWDKAARAIMTTDTFPKAVSRHTEIAGVPVTINGIAKGSGMIAPNMATMLGFIATDAALPAHVLQPLLTRYTQKTFNAITVDSDTSTNDTLLLIATGAAENPAIDNAGDARLDAFKAALREVMQELALLIVRDGEGATKLVTIHVTGAEDDESARVLGLSIANSPLVKTAIAASDPNWGRIIAALGKAERWIHPDNITLTIGEERVAQGGAMAATYNEANAKAHMQGSEITMRVDVGMGEGEATVWTCDFTENYIKINANYRT
jgi:glutamate N-acetyltransferase/amino-acid N-acetyltransferase